MKQIYTIEFDGLIVFDWQSERDAIFYSLYSARQCRHKIYNYYKIHFESFKNVKMKDFKIKTYERLE